MAIPLGPGDKALTYALGGVMRGGVGRAGAVSGKVFITYDGKQIGFAREDGDPGVIQRSLSIADILDETPNTCQFRVNGAVPKTGGEIVITLGSKNRLGRLFAGFGLTVTQRYAARRPQWVQADVAAVDYTWLLGFLKTVTRQYRNQSASAIIIDLIARYGAVNGFTTRNVVPNLPAIDEITFTEEDLPGAITRTVRRVGAYWYVDYNKDIHAFVTEVDDGAPPPLVPDHHSFANFTRRGDVTQLLSRVYVEGRGSVLLASVALNETMLPLEAVDMFIVAPDVFAKASFRGAEGGAQYLTYTGVVSGGGGALVGTGIGPSSLVTLARQTGGAVDLGLHRYAYTWVTAAGESLPGPLANVTIDTIAAPTQAPLVTYDNAAAQKPPHLVPGTGAWKTGDTVEWAYAYSYAFPPPGGYNPSYATPVGPITAIVAQQSPYWFQTPGDSAKGFIVNYLYSPDPNVKYIQIWHRVNGAGPWYSWYYATIQNLPGGDGTGGFNIHANSAETYATAATGATAAPNLRTVNVTGIGVGPAAVTARRIYRTVANGSQLKLVAALVNNTSTTWLDGAADATLGVNVPAGDTSGLQQAAGQVLPGATSVPVAGTGAFPAAGGWATIGNGEQTIRYTGVSANALTGIPAVGPGAITAAISFNTTITQAPMLIGVAGMTDRGLTAGDDLYLVVVATNTFTREALIQVKAGDGWRDEWISDRRLSVTEARARALATLTLRQPDPGTIAYTCRDLLTRSGKTIHVALPAPTNVTGDFKIQSVTIHNFRPHANQYPTFTVQASASRFSFEDLLNRIKTKE